jgi:hypothetical protein
MAGQTVVRDFALLVATGAVFHSYSQKRRCNGFRLLVHIAVASRTLQFSGRHMTAMGEIDVIWHSVNSFPRNFFSFSNVRENLEFFR